MAREQLEVYIAVDENGDYWVGREHDEAIEGFGDNVGFSAAVVCYHLSVDVPLPTPREATITLADDAPVEIVATVQE